MNSNRDRPSFQNLESRRLLAGDFIAGESTNLNEVAAIFAADVNADGNITASDALEVINELNADGVIENVTRSVREAVDVNGDGELSARDALQVINRLQSSDVRVVDSVMRLIPEAEDLVDSVDTSLRSSLAGLIDQLNGLRSRIELPREAVVNVVQEITDVVQDSQLLVADRNSQIVDRVTNIVESVGLDPSEVRQLTTRVEEVLETLPVSLATFIDSIDEEILVAAEQIASSLDEGLSIFSVGNLVSSLRDLNLDVSLPSFSSVIDFVGVYRSTTADGTFTEPELLQLRASAGVVLSSAGIVGELQDDLLEGFNQVIRLRF